MIRILRRIRAAWCKRQGHPAPTKPVDVVMGNHPVRLTVCSRCDTILAGEVRTSRASRRAARKGRTHLVGTDGRPLDRDHYAKGGIVRPGGVILVGESGPEVVAAPAGTRVIRP